MYLHIGKDSVVKTEEIIGIFDIERTTVSKITKDYLKFAEKQKNTVTVTDEIPKSFVVCEKKKNKKVYICQISPSTIEKRINNERFFAK